MKSDTKYYIKYGIALLFIMSSMLFCGFAFGLHFAKSDSEISEDYSYPKPDFSQCTKTELAMAPELVPYFESFIKDCEEHNFKYDHAYCLKWMRFEHSRIAQGETDLYDGNIVINENLVRDTIGMKFVIYHELGHWFGLHHSNNGMMKVSYNTKEDKQYVTDNWTELKEDYFAKLKLKYDGE